MIFTGWEIEYEKNKQEYIELFNNTLNKKQETDISFLEESLCKLTGRKYAVACASGTDALHMALCAIDMEFSEEDEILVPSFSWISSASCVSMAGAIPSFCDIDLDSYHMSLDSMDRMYTAGKKYQYASTKAVVYPHLFGSMSDPEPIEDWCRERDLYLIEDACQAIGASYKGRKAGSIGDISTFSFNANKNIAGIAGGGAILTDKEDIASHCRMLRQHGNGKMLGYNSKMLLLNAAVIDHRLKKIDQWQFYRQQVARLYDNAFKDLPVTIQNDPNVDHNYHKYVVRFENKETRDKVQKAIGAAVHYSKPICEEDMYVHELGHWKDDIPNARLICDTILTLPLHHYSDFEDIIKTADTIKDVIS